MSRHVGAAVSAYVDRRLTAPTLAALDRHVITCIRCQAAVDAERAVRDSLRQSEIPGLPGSLHQSLLRMASPAQPLTSAPDLHSVTSAAPAGYPYADVVPASRTGPPAPPTPFTPRREVRVLAPGAPAQHVSPFRAIAIGGFAAGAAAAAAWGIVASGPVAVGGATFAPTGVATVRVEPVASLNGGRGAGGLGSWASVRSVPTCSATPGVSATLIGQGAAVTTSTASRPACP